jgi:cytochrome P450
MLYALVLLALHPEVQTKLHLEVRDIVGDTSRTYNDFPILIYPLCILFETLQLFPPLTAIPKCNPHDEYLMKKYYVPRNTAVDLDTFHVHRNPKYWGEDADKFNPSRFDGRNMVLHCNLPDSDGGFYEKMRMPQKGAFIPFSDGTRACLGSTWPSMI